MPGFHVDIVGREPSSKVLPKAPVGSVNAIGSNSDAAADVAADSVNAIGGDIPNV